MHFFLVAVLVLVSVSQAQGQSMGDAVLAVAKKDLPPTKPFTLLIQFKVNEGQAQKFEAAMATTIKETRKEKGNQAYELSKAPSGRRYVIFERWENLAALESHLKTAYYKNASDMVLPLLEERISVELLVPVLAGD